MEWLDLSFHPQGDRLFVRAVDTDNVEHLVDMGERSEASIALNQLMAKAAGDGGMVVLHSDPCHLNIEIATKRDEGSDQYLPPTVMRAVARAFMNVETVTLKGDGDPLRHPDLLAILDVLARQTPGLRVTLETGGDYSSFDDLAAIVNHQVLSGIVFKYDSGVLLDLPGNQDARLLELFQARCGHEPKISAAIDVALEDVNALIALIRQLQNFDLSELDCRNNAHGNKSLVSGTESDAIRLLEDMQREVQSRFPVKLPQVFRQGDGFHCRQAFDSFALSSSGTLKPCSEAVGGEGALFAGREDWNGAILRQTREAIAGGQMPLEACQSCRQRCDPDGRMMIRSEPETPPINLDRAFDGAARQAAHKAMNEEREAHFNSTVLRAERMPLGPRTLALGIANPCNFRCPFCIYHATDLKKSGTHADYPVKYMPVENIKNAVRQFWPERVSLGVTGEAFLHPEIDEILSFLEAEGIKASFSSNMALPGFLEVFSRHGAVFSSINISLDATTQEEYVRLTPKSKLSDTLNIVKEVDRLLAVNGLGAEFECNFVVERKPGWPDFIRRGLSLVQGLDLKRLSSINFNNCVGLTKEIDHTLTVADGHQISELLAEFTAAGPYPYDIRLPLVLDMNRPNSCTDPWHLLSVGPDMTASPCCRVVPNEAIGRLDRDGPLLWNNEVMVESRRRIAKGLDAFEICKTCPSRGGDRPVITAHSTTD